jgi:hypothetical protein
VLHVLRDSNLIEKDAASARSTVGSEQNRRYHAKHRTSMKQRISSWRIKSTHKGEAI